MRRGIAEEGYHNVLFKGERRTQTQVDRTVWAARPHPVSKSEDNKEGNLPIMEAISCKGSKEGL